ncbi:MAG TPA: sensor histidine kinase KdpD [Bacteroidales bacterium]|nr:sensor histidine kinase KdpD [Bacteroidales bacterium]
MMESIRPNPDELLKSIQKEEEKVRKGRLRVFLGMCAGSGKTYAMLKAAHQAVTEGIDLVAGYVETHGRLETDELMTGLKCIPRLQRKYRDVVLEEMDLDAILARSPKVVLVDELAHTNVPESRHLKRYQDVEELLNRGINVYTTLNVQHLESRSETITEITGVRIHETVPDSLLQDAEFDLIDISPDELLKRMSEGKVYVPNKAQEAVSNFFRKGNLHALREIALRFTAERVDIDLMDYMHAKNILATWKTTEKLLVAVGPSPASQRLIRWTRRMAYNLGAQWIAVSIDLGMTLSAKQREALARNQELARDLGAKILQITDNDIVSGLLKVAVQYNVTQIVIGKTNEHPLRNYLNGGSIVDRLLKNSQNIDIYVVKDDRDVKSTHSFWKNNERKNSWKEYLYVFIIITAIGVVSFPFRTVVGYQTVGLFFLLGIAGLSIKVGRLPVIFSALLGSLVWNFFFIPPLLTFHINNFHDVMALFANFFVAMTGGTLINKLRKSQVVLQKSQDNLSKLFSILESLNNTDSIKEVVRMTRVELNKQFDADAVVYLQTRTDDGVQRRLDDRVFGNIDFHDDKGFSVAHWVFENKAQAGRHTNTLPDAPLQYFPLISKKGIIGVLGIKFSQKEKLTPGNTLLLRSFISQVTASLQREINVDEMKTKQIYAESQKLFQTVLNSISHELRTPISVISAAVSNMNDEKTASNAAFRKELGQELNAAAMRLNMLVENILDISRIESGYLSLNLQWYEISDLMGTVLNEMEREPHQQSIQLELEENLPLVQMDLSWFKQALVNIVHNAILYTPAETVITIRSYQNSIQQLIIEVSDNGPGIPEDSLKNLFEKFYRVPGTKSGGTGLGLTITKAIVEAHHAGIVARNRQGGGLSILITFDLERENGQH